MTSPQNRRIWIGLGAVVALLISIPAVPGCSWRYRLWAIRTKSADPLFQFEKDGKAGYMDAKGRVVIQPNLHDVGGFGGEFHEGLLRVKDEVGYRYIDKSGATAFRLDAWLAFEFSEGLAAAALESGPSRRVLWGFIDRTGRFVIEPKYFTVSGFSEGLARVGVEGQFGSTGYIDQFGNFAIPPTLSDGSSFHEGLAIAIMDGPCLITNGGSCSPPKFRPARRDADYDCRFRIIDKTGRPVSELRFDGARDFSEGLAAVRLGELWGYADKSGHIAIEPQFEYSGEFSQGRAAVSVNGKWGFIDRSGAFVIPPRFESAAAFSDGRAVVYEKAADQEGYYRFIDMSGAPAFPATYAFAESFTFGLAAVELPSTGNSGRQAAWIDTAGRIVYQFRLK
ncbi:WG repeat-containing protein [Paludibaculum fermentans]|uniref:WG repeat-containing protein n=1 Tax=Paludibaculum fermentans TaxID=1473598 RepID=UPI003EBE1265